MKCNDKSLSTRSALVATAAALVAAVFFLIYGILLNEYFDLVVLVCDLVAVAGFASYALLEDAVSPWMNLVGVGALSFSMGLLFLNSYPVWADWYGNFDMYGSRGGIAPVVAQLVICIIGIIAGIISCFSEKGGKAQ